MPRAIELTTFEDRAAISDLATAIWASTEPGFQIDGVSSVDELFDVFRLLRMAAPTEAASQVQFNEVYPLHPEFPGYLYNPDLAGVAHVDDLCLGFAAHHNLNDHVGVTLALSDYQGTGSMPVDLADTTEMRVGETVPGRLTIFSEGGYDTLKRTAHQFLRPARADSAWARYFQNAPENNHNVPLVEWIARAAFERLAQQT